MNAPARSTEAQWLRRVRGDQTQDSLAADIAKVTGWRITRDRYSKYESGSLPIGRQTLAHFVAYWGSRGMAGPEDIPPEPRPADLTKLVADLIAEIQAERAERAAERAERLEWERGLVSAVQDIARGLGRQGDPAAAPHEGALR